jgi:hypothetical protein
LEFDWSELDKKIDFKEIENKGYAIDLKYSVTDQQWTFTLYHPINKITDLVDIPSISDWKVIDEKVTFGNSELNSYDIQKSLLENNIEIVQRTNELISSIEQLLSANKK